MFLHWSLALPQLVLHCRHATPSAWYKIVGVQRQHVTLSSSYTIINLFCLFYAYIWWIEIRSEDYFIHGRSLLFQWVNKQQTILVLFNTMTHCSTITGWAPPVYSPGQPGLCGLSFQPCAGFSHSGNLDLLANLGIFHHGHRCLNCSSGYALV